MSDWVADLCSSDLTKSPAPRSFSKKRIVGDGLSFCTGLSRKLISAVLPVPDLPLTMVLAIAFAPRESSPGWVAWKLKYYGWPLVVCSVVTQSPQGLFSFLPVAKLCSGERPRKLRELTFARRVRYFQLPGNWE